MTTVALSMLVVEDDAYTLATMVDMLAVKYPGAVIHTADNGRDGLQVLDVNDPDLVITDLAMPIVDGICMAAEIKRIRPETVVVAVTAYTDTSDLLRAIEIGIDHYLLKPLKVDKLFAVVDKVAASKAEAMQRERSEEALREWRERYQAELSRLNEQLERRVVERTAELENALRELESFSYSVSHDLRAPLRHINCFSAMLSEDFGKVLPPEAHSYLDRIGEASSRMGMLIDHLLELSRVMRTDIRPEPVDLSELAGAVLKMLRETEPMRRADVRVQEGIVVHGDHYLLRQLLENLLGNAWKYTATRERASIEVGSTEAGGEQVLFVRDNGAGFDMAYHNSLFEAFQRLHGAEFEGMGIGLATAHRIVQRHGGTIWAEAKVEEGATFYFTLPDRNTRANGREATAAVPGT